MVFKTAKNKNCAADSRRNALRLTLCVLAVLLAFTLASCGALPAASRPEAATEPNAEKQSPVPAKQAQGAAQADYDFLSGRVNILLIGADISEERLINGQSDYESDVLMLLACDFSNNKVELISIPRDTYAPIYKTPGRHKINRAFAIGGGFEGQGCEYAAGTVSALLGVSVDYYVGVDMNSLRDLVDALGGVDYYVDVPISINGRVIEVGPQRLNGQQVLDYCRARKGISTDVGRADRQQRMLMAIFNELRSSDGLAAIPKVYSAMNERIHTNLSAGQIAALALFGAKDSLGIDRQTLSGKYINVYDASYYVLDLNDKERLVQEIFEVRTVSDPRYGILFAESDAAVEKAIKEASTFLDRQGANLSGEQKTRLLSAVDAARSAYNGQSVFDKNMRAAELVKLLGDLRGSAGDTAGIYPPGRVVEGTAPKTAATGGNVPGDGNVPGRVVGGTASPQLGGGGLGSVVK